VVARQRGEPAAPGRRRDRLRLHFVVEKRVGDRHDAASERVVQARRDRVGERLRADRAGAVLARSRIVRHIRTRLRRRPQHDQARPDAPEGIRRAAGQCQPVLRAPARGRRRPRGEDQLPVAAQVARQASLRAGATGLRDLGSDERFRTPDGSEAGPGSVRPNSYRHAQQAQVRRRRAVRPEQEHSRYDAALSDRIRDQWNRGPKPWRTRTRARATSATRAMECQRRSAPPMWPARIASAGAEEAANRDRAAAPETDAPAPG